jgi:hypothetical protein
MKRRRRIAKRFGLSGRIVHVQPTLFLRIQCPPGSEDDGNSPPRKAIKAKNPDALVSPGPAQHNDLTFRRTLSR